ncbi:958_t:CDS:2, partial [Cetraspora pellucida]
MYDLIILISEPSESDKIYKWRSNERDCKKEYNNKEIFIKLKNEIPLLAKWFIAKVSAVDELLSEIYINVKTLIKTKPIKLTNYCIAFKFEKAIGA